MAGKLTMVPASRCFKSIRSSKDDENIQDRGTTLMKTSTIFQIDGTRLQF